MKGEACRAERCPHLQPCPDHTTRGRDRINRQDGVRTKEDIAAGIADARRTRPQRTTDAQNVYGLFTKERQDSTSAIVVKPGSTAGKGDIRPRARRGIRPGKRWSEIYHAVKTGEYTWDVFVENLDAEELARGQLRDSKGHFTGRPPEFVPRQFVLACQREIFRRFNTKMQTNLEAATNELLRLAFNENLMDAKDRAKILTYFIERVMGKVPDKLEVKVADPWEQIIGGILAEVPDEGLNVPNYLQEKVDEPTP